MARLALATIVSVTSVTASLAAALSAQVTGGAELSNTCETNIVVDWRLLSFFDRKVTRVRIMLTPDGERLLRGLFKIDERGAVRSTRGPDADRRTEALTAPDLTFRYETDDPMVLEMVMTFLHMPLRVAFPDAEEGGVGMGDFTYDLAQLDVVTTKDRFAVGVTTKGFCLGRQFDGPRNVFYSWGLAEVLDDVIFEKTRRRLPEEFFHVLSGERRISKEKRRYDEIRQRHLSGRPDSGTHIAPG